MFKRFHTFMNEKIYYTNYNNVRFFYTFLCLIVVFLFFYSYTYNSAKNKKSLLLMSDVRYKKIYMWNTFWRDPTFEFGLGYETFHEHNCPVQECMIIYKDSSIPIENYDAVVFHGAEYYPHRSQDYPSERLPFQRYVHFNMESPLTRPVSMNTEGFFNWTMTYRLDSEILVFYFAFFDINTDVMVSNTKNPKWKDKTIVKESFDRRKNLLKTKSKPIAWFVSNCNSKNKRISIVDELKKYINVDVYGKCGTLECGRDNSDACNKMLKKDYYFYLSFENSNCEDYITEKSLTAYENDLVPIYYGGANLTKYLPPHSYIDARNLSAKDLAQRIQYLINNTVEYLEYFWWKDFYRIESRQEAKYKPFCKLCEMLHDSSLKEKTYTNFHQWWNSYNGHEACDTMS